MMEMMHETMNLTTTVDLAENIPARMVVVIITMKVAGAAVDAALNLVNLLIDSETEAKPQNLLKQHIHLNYGA
jgi:hypothetical protein